MTRFLSVVARLAVALLLRLGMALRPLRASGPATPALAPLGAMASPWYPSAALSFSGSRPPIERGAP